MKKFEAYQIIAEEVQKFFNVDAAVTLFDTEKIVAYYPGKTIDTRAKLGNAPTPGSNVLEALTSGQRVVRRVSKEIFGVPFVGIAQPIFEESKIAGCLAIACSLEHYDNLLITGQEILESVVTISSSAHNLSAATEELAATLRSMDSEIEQVNKEMRRTNELTQEIKKISKQSKILGINAAIEASRAGEHGRGFSIVSEEVRKLATDTDSSTQAIERNVQEVQSSVGLLIEAIKQLTEVTESHANEVTEIANSLVRIEDLAKQLLKMGQN
ncbi:methyl-accepting chemotaxis protein [Desulfosporosinus lacus]|uniref:Methyl-accepting chemotaxis protein (MCP) signalling domain-containing protein n=1 Tax=Desulfosporosinus lacus DSM 15449 TaxID=1121420 RepID=A0A1M6G7Z0_9FIRM|nr:methyl-accepting chemotaxis protein [Desulfosporosinus lacus]SHJ06028.1 Methyl-accepting chemotaxis protein (MCP) signalling domain-containing protein [Desulfosporosinus lacus DSM 15449]